MNQIIQTTAQTPNLDERQRKLIKLGVDLNQDRSVTDTEISQWMKPSTDANFVKMVKAANAGVTAEQLDPIIGLARYAAFNKMMKSNITLQEEDRILLDLNKSYSTITQKTGIRL